MGKIEGVIKNTAGKELPGVMVDLFDEKGMLIKSEVTPSKTDKDSKTVSKGRFYFDNLQPGKYTIKATGRGLNGYKNPDKYSVQEFDVFDTVSEVTKSVEDISEKLSEILVEDEEIKLNLQTLQSSDGEQLFDSEQGGFQGRILNTAKIGDTDAGSVEQGANRAYRGLNEKGEVDLEVPENKIPELPTTRVGLGNINNEKFTDTGDFKGNLVSVGEEEVLIDSTTKKISPDLLTGGGTSIATEVDNLATKIFRDPLIDMDCSTTDARWNSTGLTWRIRFTGTKDIYCGSSTENFDPKMDLKDNDGNELLDSGGDPITIEGIYSDASGSTVIPQSTEYISNVSDSFYVKLSAEPTEDFWVTYAVKSLLKDLEQDSFRTLPATGTTLDANITDKLREIIHGTGNPGAWTDTVGSNRGILVSFNESGELSAALNITAQTSINTGNLTQNDGFKLLTINQEAGANNAYSHLDTNGLKATSKVGDQLASDVAAEVGAKEFTADSPFVINDPKARILKAVKSNDDPIVLQDGTEPIGCVATVRPGEGPNGGPALAIEEGTTNILTANQRNALSTSFIPYSSNLVGDITSEVPPRNGNYSTKFTYINDANVATTYVIITNATHVMSCDIWVPSTFSGSSCGIYQKSSFSGATSSFTSADLNIRDKWQRVYFTVTPDSGDLSGEICIFAIGATTNDYVVCSAFQCEPGDFATSWCNGTRTAGQLRFAASTFPTGDFTAVCKFIPTVSNINRTLISRYGNNVIEDRDFWIIISSTNRFNVRWEDGSGSEQSAVSSIIPNIGEWNHFSIKIVGTSLNILVNGEPFFSATLTGYSRKSNVTWGFGTKAGGGAETEYPANGKFDPLCMAVIPRALSDAEIKAIGNNRAGLLQVIEQETKAGAQTLIDTRIPAEKVTKLDGIAEGANVNAPSIGVKANYEDFDTWNSGELFIHGFDKNGNPADVDGWIQYKGQKHIVPKTVAYTSVVDRGYLIYDTAHGTPWNNKNIAFAKKEGDVWYYDDNSGNWVSFTTAATYTVIGTCTTNPEDTVETVEIWGYGQSLDLIPNSLALNYTEFSTEVDTSITTGIENSNKVYKIVAKRYQASSYPTELETAYARILLNGSVVSTFASIGRSYNVAVYDRATGSFDSFTTYDVYTSADNAATMAAALNVLGKDKIVIVIGAHAPYNNRTTNGLPDALYRCGASERVFLNHPYWVDSTTRPCYLLVGVPGMGKGSGKELITDHDTGWLLANINLLNGAFEFSQAQPSTWSELIDNDGNKPADGADVTAENTAADTATVNGVAANIVEKFATAQLPSSETLVSHWSFNEGDGLNNAIIRDQSPNKNHLVITGGDPSWVKGVSGSAIEFTSPIRLNAQADTDYINNEFTLSVWTRPSSIDSELKGIFGFYHHSNKTGAVVCSNGANMMVYYGSGSVQYSLTWTNVFTVNTLNHIVLRFDGSKFILMVDGVIKTYQPSISIDFGSVKWAVGQWAESYDNHYTYDGLIDEARAYNSYLTDAECYALYLNPGGLQAPIPGADITSENIAADTSLVNGEAASVVTNKIVKLDPADGKLDFDNIKGTTKPSDNANEVEFDSEDGTVTIDGTTYYLKAKDVNEIDGEPVATVTGKLLKYPVELLDDSNWIVGTELPDRWDNGLYSTESIRKLAELPFGGEGVVWETAPQQTTSWAGQIATDEFKVDTNYSYRFIVFTKAAVIPDVDFYLGTSNFTEKVQRWNGSTWVNTSNPYFMSGSDMTVGKWFLCIGYLYAEGTAYDSQLQFEVYDCETKQRVNSSIANPHRFKSGTEEIFLRAGSYSVPLESRLQMVGVQVHRIDGKEPSIPKLLQVPTDVRIEKLVGTSEEIANLRDGRKADGDRIIAGRLNISDTRNDNLSPNEYEKGVHNEFKHRSAIGAPGIENFGSLETVKPWSDGSGGYTTQTFKSGDGVFKRSAPNNATSWGAWQKVYDEVNKPSLVNDVIDKSLANLDSDADEGLNLLSGIVPRQQLSILDEAALILDNASGNSMSGVEHKEDSVFTLAPGEGPDGRDAILIEAGTTNLGGPDPDFSTSTNNLVVTNAWDGTMVAVREALSDSQYGGYVVKLTRTLGGGADEKSAYRKSVTGLTASTDYTISIYVRRTDDGDIDNDVAQVHWLGGNRTTVWNKLSNGWWLGTATLSSETYTSSVTGVTVHSDYEIYLDAIQVEEKAYYTSFTTGIRDNGYLEFSASHFPTTPFFMSFKFRAINNVQSGHRVPFYLGTGADDFYILLGSEVDRLSMYINGSDPYIGEAQTWTDLHTISIGWDGSNFYAYLDGKREQSLTLASVDASTFIIGSRISPQGTHDWNANGYFSDFAIIPMTGKEDAGVFDNIAKLAHANRAGFAHPITPGNAQVKVDDRLSTEEKFNLEAGKRPDGSKTFANVEDVPLNKVIPGITIGSTSANGARGVQVEIKNDVYLKQIVWKTVNNTENVTLNIYTITEMGSDAVVNSPAIYSKGFGSIGNEPQKYLDIDIQLDAGYYLIEVVTASGGHGVNTAYTSEDFTAAQGDLFRYSKGWSGSGWFDYWYGLVSISHVNGYAGYVSGSIAGQDASTVIYQDGNCLKKISDNVTVVAEVGADVTPQLPTDEGLIGYWSFDEKSGDVIRDASPTGAHGNVVDVDRVAGPSGNALSFDSYTKYAKLTGDPYSSLTFTEFSFSYWLKVDSLPDPGEFSAAVHRNDGSEIGSSLIYGGVSSGNVIVATINANEAGGWAVGTTTITPTLGKWYHVVASWDGSTVRVYVNGEEEQSYALNTFTNKTCTIHFGQSADGTSGGYYLHDGSVDEVRFYNKGLTASEVKALYLNPGGLKNPVPGADVTSEKISFSEGNVIIDGASNPLKAQDVNQVYGVSASEVQNGAAAGTTTASYFSEGALKLSSAPDGIKNSTITLGTDGTLNNAGGGQVTADGISAAQKDLGNIDKDDVISCVNNAKSNIVWTKIDKSGSNLTDLASRSYSNLTGKPTISQQVISPNLKNGVPVVTDVTSSAVEEEVAWGYFVASEGMSSLSLTCESRITSGSGEYYIRCYIKDLNNTTVGSCNEITGKLPTWTVQKSTGTLSGLVSGSIYKVIVTLENKGPYSAIRTELVNVYTT